MGGLVSGLFGGGKKAAKRQAEATLKAANMQAASDRETARAAVLTMSNLSAQARAADVAAEKLSRPQPDVDVLLAPEAEAPEIDPLTNRRRTARSSFFSRPTSGIAI